VNSARASLASPIVRTAATTALDIIVRAGLRVDIAPEA